ncbi:hypothetical protein Ancab_033556 [Ancistrocladus abbreviatus]
MSRVGSLENSRLPRTKLVTLTWRRDAKVNPEVMSRGLGTSDIIRMMFMIRFGLDRLSSTSAKIPECSLRHRIHLLSHKVVNYLKKESDALLSGETVA